MRHAPLEDPALTRGVALSTALAKELTQLFQSVCQKACFAQMAVVAQAYGLQQATLPARPLQVLRLPTELLAFLVYAHVTRRVQQHAYSIMYAHVHAAK